MHAQTQIRFLLPALLALCVASAVAAEPTLHTVRDLQRVRHDPHCPGCDICDAAEPAPTQPMPKPPELPQLPPPGNTPEIDMQIAGSFGAASGPQSGSPTMIGDYLGNVGTSGQIVFDDSMFGTFALTNAVSPFLTRTFKIAEGEAVRPTDRIYGEFNYYHNVGSDLSRFQVGIEKTFFDGRTSLGVRLPMWIVNPDSFLDGGGNAIGTFGSGTTGQADLGDISLIFKLALLDPGAAGAATLGLAVTPPTGPDTLADVDALFTTEVDHEGTIQPFAGAIIPLANRWFLHGFTSLDVPFDSDDSVFWFNDVGLGRTIVLPGPTVTALIPTVEFHVNVPLNNRTIAITGATPAAQNLTGGLFPVIGATGNIELHSQVNLTAGLTLELNRRASLAFGYVLPLARPHPFDGELVLQYQWFGWRGSPMAGLQGY